MEELNASEVELENQIETYKAQLQVVKDSVPQEQSEEVKQLLSDLKQLVELTEENLMEVKKQKLLFMLQSTPAAPSGEHTEQETACLDQLDEEDKPADEKEEGEEDDLVGMECSAPLKESWEAEERYYNAVILCRESVTSADAPADASGHASSTCMTSDPTPCEGVRVLFSQPLYASMRPCPYFMEGSCRYSADDCRFSHGHVVAFSSLRPVNKPDYELLHIGGRCLARNSDDELWYSAVLSSVGEECEVYFPTLSRVLQVPMEHVYPLESSGESSSEEEEEEEVVVQWKARDCAASFGQWEQHTKGIGSKLLSKMGYVTGQGLGRDGQGRLEPVEIVVLPAGKSLDVCAALREKEKVRNMEDNQKIIKRRRRRRKKNGQHKDNVEPSQRPASNMFDFLNSKVFNRDKKTSTSVTDTPPVTITSSSSSSNLNVKLFQLEEEKKTLIKRQKSLQQALLRHRSRKDKALEAQVKEKLSEVQARLEQLHRREAAVQTSITSRAQQKKLTLF